MTSSSTSSRCSAATTCWAGALPELDEDTAREILNEVSRLATDRWRRPSEGDRDPPVYDPGTGSVHMPEGFKKSYQAFVDAEWFRLELPPNSAAAALPAGWAGRWRS